MANKRVKDLTTDTSLSAGDYVLLDSASEGTRKFDLGTEIGDLKDELQEIESGGMGVSDDLKEALLSLASKVSYITDEDGESCYNELYDSLYPQIVATGITLSDSSLEYTTTGATKQITATLTPQDATTEIVWTSSDDHVATVSDGGLVTIVGLGSALITAVAGSVSATCSVVVAAATLSSISAVYTQSGTVYDTAALDDLKTDLVVTAHWSDTTTSTVASTDYTLSGTLTAGTSTITVSYGGKTTTFTVTVTHFQPIQETITWSGSGTDNTSTVVDATQHDVYITIPYTVGDTRYGADAAAGGNCVKERALLYENYDSETGTASNFVGYWYVDTQTIETGSRTVAQRPWLKFDTEYKIAPQGYYVKWVFSKSGSIFSSNANCRTYLNDYGKTVDLK